MYVLGLITMYPIVNNSYVFVTHLYITDKLKIYIVNISMRWNSGRNHSSWKILVIFTHIENKCTKACFSVFDMYLHVCG